MYIMKAIFIEIDTLSIFRSWDY